MTTKTKRIVVSIVIAVFALLMLISMVTRTVQAISTTTTETKNENVYNVDLQTVVEVHYKHVEKGGKNLLDGKPVYEAKTEGIIIYTVQSSDGTIVDRVAFVLDDLWEALK
jgi:hypothetical protein